MSKNNVFLTTVSVIIIFAFLIIVYMASNSGSSQDTQVYKQLQTVMASDHVKWGIGKKNVLVEFSDFQCPACGNFHQLLKTYEASGSADAKVASNIAFVYKHFPLENIHKNARVAAYAAEAACKQGKFFEMGNLLFDNQRLWENESNPTPIFESYVKELKLDLTQYRVDVKSSEVQKKIDGDLVLGNQVKVNATPSFYLNGKKLEYTTLAEFKNALTAALATAK